MSTPTELYLVRHAIAAERGSEWPDDTKRPLTERGISRFKEAVKGLRHLDVTVDEIVLHCPDLFKLLRVGEVFLLDRRLFNFGQITKQIASHSLILFSSLPHFNTRRIKTGCGMGLRTVITHWPSPTTGESRHSMSAGFHFLFMQPLTHSSSRLRILWTRLRSALSGMPRRSAIASRREIFSRFSSL